MKILLYDLIFEFSLHEQKIYECSLIWNFIKKHNDGEWEMDIVEEFFLERFDAIEIDEVKDMNVDMSRDEIERELTYIMNIYYPMTTVYDIDFSEVI